MPACTRAGRGSRETGHGPWSRARTSRLCGWPSAPLLLDLPLYRWRVQVLALDPVRRATGTIAGIAALRNKALKAKLAGAREHGRAILLDMLVPAAPATRPRNSRRLMQIPRLCGLHRRGSNELFNRGWKWPAAWVVAGSAQCRAYS